MSVDGWIGESWGAQGSWAGSLYLIPLQVVVVVVVVVVMLLLLNERSERAQAGQQR